MRPLGLRLNQPLEFSFGIGPKSSPLQSETAVLDPPNRRQIDRQLSCLSRETQNEKEAIAGLNVRATQDLTPFGGKVYDRAGAVLVSTKRDRYFTPGKRQHDREGHPKSRMPSQFHDIVPGF